MGSRAIAGHGALLAMELDPVGAPGIFTTIAELNGDMPFPNLKRNATNVTAHTDDIDWNVFGVLMRDPITFGTNYIYDDETHDHLTGLAAAIISNERRGFRFTGPGGGVDDDEIIVSGEVSEVGPVQHPVRDGARTRDVTITLSGPMKMDGVMIGSAT